MVSKPRVPMQVAPEFDANLKISKGRSMKSTRRKCEPPRYHREDQQVTKF